MEVQKSKQSFSPLSPRSWCSYQSHKMGCCRFCCGAPRMLGRQWSTLEGHLVCHIVILSHTHVQRVASLRRPEVAGTAEASRFNFVSHQILSGHMIMPLWVGVHNVWQGRDVILSSSCVSVNICAILCICNGHAPNVLHVHHVCTHDSGYRKQLCFVSRISL
jgi:hypothetical protein